MARGPDIIQRQSIPLSATSDQPVDDVARPPLNASGNADDQAKGAAREISPEELAQGDAARKGDPATAGLTEASPDADDLEAEAADEVAAEKVEKIEPVIDDDGIEIDPTKLPNYAIKEISKVRKATRERIAAIQAEAKTAADAAAALKIEADNTRRELDELRAKVPEAPKVEEKPDPRPTRDTFDDPDLYDEAVVSWGKREGLREAAHVAAQTKAQQDAEAKRIADEATKVEQDAMARKAHADWMTKTELAKEKYADYEDVALKDPADGGPSISPAMGMAIQAIDNGTDVAYHLGTDIEESQRIAKLPAMTQVIEIARLAERLANPPRRAARPRPIEPVQSNRTPPENPDDEDMAAYHARRSRELAANRAPFFPPGGLH